MSDPRLSVIPRPESRVSRTVAEVTGTATLALLVFGSCVVFL